MRGTILKLHRDAVINRWLTNMLAVPVPPKGAPKDAGFRPIHYRLESENGDKDPTADYCCDWSYGGRTPTADCVGFILHGCGIDRLQPGYKGSSGPWLHCPSILTDAIGPRTFFRLLATDEPVLPADLLVTNDHIAGILRPAIRAPFRLQPAESADPDYDHLVIDCSPRHGRNSAIGIGGPWSDNCTVVRPLFYADP